MGHNNVFDLNARLDRLQFLIEGWKQGFIAYQTLVDAADAFASSVKSLAAGAGAPSYQASPR